MAQVGRADRRDVEQSDAIFAVVNRVPPDEGVMVELCTAIALRKSTFLSRDDLRRATDSEEYPLNLCSTPVCLSKSVAATATRQLRR